MIEFVRNFYILNSNNLKNKVKRKLYIEEDEEKAGRKNKRMVLTKALKNEEEREGEGGEEE